jgi:hypothetical protein
MQQPLTRLSRGVLLETRRGSEGKLSAALMTA